MTYTTHRDTEETLQALDRLDLDTEYEVEVKVKLLVSCRVT